jgi:hypothetical protein
MPRILLVAVAIAALGGVTAEHLRLARRRVTA